MTLVHELLRVDDALFRVWQLVRGDTLDAHVALLFLAVELHSSLDVLPVELFQVSRVLHVLQVK